MPSSQPAFQNQFDHQCACTVETTQLLIREIETYSNAKELTGADVTQITALNNALTGLLNLMITINSHAK